MNSQNRNLAGVIFVVLSASPCAFAAEKGNRFDSYRDMHNETQYGSLFFNEGSIRNRDNGWRKRFLEIIGSGELNLPSQEGYCFVFNHYGSPDGENGSQKFRLKITRTFTDGVERKPQILERDFSPTDNVVSSNLPGWCIAGLFNVSKVSLEFSSDDGAFNRVISFPIR